MDRGREAGEGSGTVGLPHVAAWVAPQLKLAEVPVAVGLGGWRRDVQFDDLRFDDGRQRRAHGGLAGQSLEVSGMDNGSSPGGRPASCGLAKKR